MTFWNSLSFLYNIDKNGRISLLSSPSIKIHVHVYVGISIYNKTILSYLIFKDFFKPRHHFYLDQELQCNQSKWNFSYTCTKSTNTRTDSTLLNTCKSNGNKICSLLYIKYFSPETVIFHWILYERFRNYYFLETVKST